MRLVSIVMGGAALAVACQGGAPAAPSASAAPRASASAPAEGAKLYGAPLAAGPATALAEVLKTPAAFEGKTVTCEGAVRQACTRKGCWMEIAESMDKAAAGARVTFKDYAFFVPTSSAGARARLQGTVQVREITKDHVAHLEEEGASFPSKRPDGTAIEVQFVATGVELRR